MLLHEGRIAAEGAVLAYYDEPNFFDDERFEFRIKPEEKPKVEVSVDVKVNDTTSDSKIKVTINGKVCTFDNVEDARKVLGLETKE